MPTSALLLVNPKAGGARADRFADAAAALLEDTGCQLTVHRTRDAADAVAAARSTDADWCVCLGGDGTVQSAAQGLWAGDAMTALVPLPGGRGNDLCRALGLTRDPLSVLRGVLAHPRSRRIDALHVTPADRLVLGVVSIGIDAAANALVEQAQRTGRGVLARLAGAPLYAGAALLALRTWRGLPLHLSHPGGDGASSGRAEELGDVWVCAVSNSGRYGGGMRISPASQADDGRCEVVVISGIDRPEFLRTFPRVFTGGHVRHRRVQVLDGGAGPITITLGSAATRSEVASPVPAFGDGELLGHLPLQIAVLPRAIEVILPASAAPQHPDGQQPDPAG